MRDYIFNIARRTSTKVFFIDASTKEQVTYRKLYDCQLNIATNLYLSSVKKGDRVVAVVDNSKDSVVLTFALMYLGATLVPVNPKADLEFFRMVIEDSKADWIITFNNIEKKWLNENTEIPILGYEELCSNITEKVEFPNITVDDELIILFSSGSTGKPKGVIQTYGNTLANFLQYGKLMGFDDDTRFLQVMPISYADGWNFSILIPFLFNSSYVLVKQINYRLYAYFDVFVNIMKCNVLVAIPSILELLNLHSNEDGSCKLDYAISSSEELTPKVKSDFEKKFCCHVYDLYGLTETGVVSYYGKSIPWREDSKGKVMEGVSIRIEEDNVVYVKSPYLFKGYCNFEGGFDGDWFCTGDMGYVDNDGYFYLIGRKGDVINVEGEKISTSIIDDMLKENDEVIESKTILMEFPNNKNLFYSFITSKNQIDFEIIQQNHRSKYLKGIKKKFWPYQIIILKKIPKTKNGKADRMSLLKIIEGS